MLVRARFGTRQRASMVRLRRIDALCKQPLGRGLSLIKPRVAPMKARTLPALACTLFLASTACAAPLVFYGHDKGRGEDVRLTSTPNADAARAAFLGLVDNAVTEDFEHFEEYAGYMSGLSLDFGIHGDSTLGSTDGNRSLWVDAVALGSTNTKGRFAISGLNYLQVSSNYFQLSFANPISAFGFHGIDIGDFRGHFEIEVIDSDGALTAYTLEDTYRSRGGGVLFWGIINDRTPFSSIRFANSNAGTDWFGFDDMILASARAIPVSEPGILGLLGLGVVMLGFMKRQKGD